MFDLLISRIFLVFWLFIFYGIIYAFNRFIPKGFVISQVLFVYLWGLLPYFDISCIGYLSYKDIPIYWIVATLIFVFINNGAKSIK